MHIGTEIMVIGTGARVYYTPWFPKGADNAIFIYEIIHSNLGSSPGAFAVTGFTKNREDIGSEGTASSNSFTSMGAGFYQAKPTNLLQLVRFRITLTPGTDPTGPEGVCYRFLPTTWYDKAI